MIKLYGFELSTPVNRVRLCLNAMELEYKFIRVNPLAGDNKTEEYLKINPHAKIPAIDDDGFILSESNAIMKYLCRKYKSGFYPGDIIAQANVDKWLDFTAIHLGNGFNKVFFNKILATMLNIPSDDASLKEGCGFIERFLGDINKQLGTSTFLAGNAMSIADFCLLATIDIVEVIDFDISKYPKVETWRNKLIQESFYKDMHGSFAETLESIITEK